MKRKQRKRWHHSIKGRLLGLFLVLALGIAAVFLLGMQRLLQGGWQAYAKPLVADYVDRLALEIGTPPDADKAGALAQRLPISVRIEGPAVQLDTTSAAAREWRENRTRHRDDDEPYTQGFGLSRSTADGHQIHFALAAPPDALRSRLFGWATLAGLLLLTALAYATVWRLLRPLQDITAGVEAFGRGQFDTPIPLHRRDELGDLSERINTMAASLHGMLDAKRALLLAMSHELRSPLTRARVNAELLEDTPERSALLRDLGEMRDLITSLLESERLAGMAEGHGALQTGSVDLAALAHEVAASQDQGQSPPLTFDLDGSIGPVQADATRLRLLLRNLIQNTRRHAADAPQPPQLFLRREADGLLAFGLRDHGPGVAPDQLSRLAEAFYRPDSARTRSSGGVGLGLHLCRLVAQAHGGALRIRLAHPGLEAAMVWRPKQ